MKDYSGEQVEHKNYGVGTIIRHDEDGTISVKFKYREAPYRFPLCFKSMLRMMDPALQEEIEQLILQMELDGRDLASEASEKPLENKARILNDGRGSSGSAQQDIIPRYWSYAGFLSDQENALTAEIAAVRFGGKNKKIRLQNGRLVETRGHAYLYTFEADTELFLPDDTAIQIWKDGNSIPGTAVHCEDFTIIIATTANFGSTNVSLQFSAEPWQLIQYLIDRLREMQPKVSPIVNELVCCGWNHIKTKEGITTGQENACAMSVKQPITFIWGPPGTGKTETLARIAIRHMQLGLRVLMVSYSNVSVDGAIWRVYNRMENHVPGEILRYGYPRDKELLDHPDLTSYRYTLGQHPELEQQREKLINEKKNCNRSSRRYIEIEQEISRLRESLLSEEKKNVQKSSFVATTVAKALADKTLYEDRFDTVIFDEASMAYIAQVVFSASLADKHFVCMGDFNQLPPIVVQNDDSCSLNTDIFAFCGITDAVRRHLNHEWLCMLNVQYRMHPTIAEYASEYMYRWLLKSAQGLADARSDMVHAVPYSGESVKMVDISGMMSVCMLSGEKSRINVLSAMIAICLAVRAAQHYEVGVITPYHAQSRLLHAMARSIMNANPELHPIKCSTVHQFQGSEMPVIIFDTVDCYRQQYPGILLTSRKQSKADRLFNVALTRAQGKFIMVTNVEYMETKNLSSDLFLKRMIDELSVHSDSGNSLVEHLKSSVLSAGTDSDYEDMYFNDLRMAKEEILIDVPFSGKGFDVKHYRTLCLELKGATDRLVDLYIRAENPEALPVELRKSVTLSKESANPITIIDRCIVWYGYPRSRAEFKLKDGLSLKTEIRPVFRFAGSDMARSLMNMLQMGNADVITYEDLHIPGYVRSPEQESVSGRMHDPEYYVVPSPSKHVSAKKYSSFADYVNEKLRCNQCGGQMVLTVYKGGIRRLGCVRPHCGAEREIGLKEVNDYLSHSKRIMPLRCPYDHTILKPVVIAGRAVLLCEGETGTDPKNQKKIHKFSPGTI